MRQMHPATQMRSPRQPSSQRRCRQTLRVQLPNQNFLNYVFSSQLLSFCFLRLASQLNGSTRSHVSHISKRNLSPVDEGLTQINQVLSLFIRFLKHCSDLSSALICG